MSLSIITFCVSVYEVLPLTHNLKYMELSYVLHRNCLLLKGHFCLFAMQSVWTGASKHPGFSKQAIRWKMKWDITDNAVYDRGNKKRLKRNGYRQHLWPVLTAFGKFVHLKFQHWLMGKQKWTWIYGRQKWLHEDHLTIYNPHTFVGSPLLAFVGSMSMRISNVGIVGLFGICWISVN